jgi:hypothetical protein
MTAAEPAAKAAAAHGPLKRSPQSGQRVHNNIHSKSGIVLGEEPFVTEVIVPLTTVVFIAV